jgi:hypothetical protein
MTIGSDTVGMRALPTEMYINAQTMSVANCVAACAGYSFALLTCLQYSGECCSSDLPKRPSVANLQRLRKCPAELCNSCTGWMYHDLQWQFERILWWLRQERKQSPFKSSLTFTGSMFTGYLVRHPKAGRIWDATRIAQHRGLS